MRKWIKKITKKEIIDLLRKKDKDKHVHTLPEYLDIKMKNYIYSQKKDDIKIEKTKKIFFSGRLKYVFVAAVILIAVPITLLIINNLNVSTDETGLGPVKTEWVEKAFISLTTGKVLHRNYMNDTWRELNVGDELTGNMFLKTEAASYVEIIYSKNSALCIQENSEVYIKKMETAPDNINTYLYLSKGVLLSSVDTLLDDSKVLIETEYALFLVKESPSYHRFQGTRFMITADAVNKSSTVAVKQGTVIAQMKLSTPEKIEHIKQASKEIAGLLPDLLHQEIYVNENKQLTITHDSVENTQQSIEQLSHDIAFKLDQALIDSKHIDDAIIQDIKYTINNLATREKDNLVKKIQDMNDSEWKGLDASSFFESTGLMKEKWVRKQRDYGILSVDTGTGETTIYLNEKKVQQGEGVLKLIMDCGENIQLKAVKQGVKDYVIDIDIIPGKTTEILIEWEKAEPETDSSTLYEQDEKLVAGEKVEEEKPIPEGYVYSSDFSQDDKRFMFKPAPDGYAGIIDGCLYLRAARSKNRDEMASEAILLVKYGENSRVSFKIKTGEIIHENTSLADIHIFYFSDKERFQLFMLPQGFDYVFRSIDKDVKGHLPYFRFESYVWYTFTIDIYNNRIIFLINDNFYGSIQVETEISEKKMKLSFNCINEYWIDDLEIYKDS